MSYLFTADTHFNHKNINRYCGRPFKTVEEMNETLITNWNSKVRPEDTVYHLGDFGFLHGNSQSVESIISRLNGNIGLIIGSHDKDLKNAISEHDFATASSKLHVLHAIETAQFQIGGTELVTIVMCHYAMRVWPYSHYGSWQIHGHSHGHLRPQGKQHDVGVDANNFFPVSLDQLKAIMWALPNNIDLP